MAGKAAELLRAELEKLLLWQSALSRAFEEVRPDEADITRRPDGRLESEALASEVWHTVDVLRQPLSRVVSGARQGLADQVRECSEWTAKERRVADAHLQKVGAPSLSALTGALDKVTPRVLERGVIRNEEEYYVVKEAVLDQERLSDEDRARLDEMLSAFEARKANARSRRKR